MASELRRLSGTPPSQVVETVGARRRPLVGCVFRGRRGAAGAGHRRAGLVPGTAVCQGIRRLSSGPDGSPVLAGRCRSDPAHDEVDPPVAVAPVGTGDDLLQPDDLIRWTALGLSLACADLVGTMSGAVQLATSYAVQRHQYGAAIGSFQAIQHLLADAYVRTEGARSVTLHAAWAVDASPAAEALAAASVAKAYSARAARHVCETAIQVHGGIGNTWECLAHAYLRRTLLSSDLLGGSGASLARVLRHRGIGGGDGLP